MQKKHLLISILALALSSPLSHTLAVSPSPSPSPSPATMGEVTDNLKKRLQEALDPEVTTFSSARAYIGIIKDVIKDTIVIEDKDGKKDVQLTEDTVILRSPGNSPIKADNIRIDDSIIAIGYPAGTDILTAKRVIVSVNPIEAPAKITAMATIKKIEKSSLTLTVGDKDQKVGLTSKTILKSVAGTIELTDLAIGDTIIYTANTDDDTQTATIVMRIKTSSL